MAEVTFSPEDIEQAEQFLADLQKENIPEGDFEAGSVLRDLAIKAIAFAFTFLQDDHAKTRALTSISEIALIEDPDEQAEALDAFVSNLFLTRRDGGYSRGIFEIFFTTLHTGTVPTDAKFFTTGGLQYDLDSVDPVYYNNNTLLPVTVSVGPTVADQVIVYKLIVPVVAAETGAAYDIDRQTLADVTPVFSPYIDHVENPSLLIGGKNTESSEELLERIPEAITVRNLLTDRAINTVLKDTFPSIQRLEVIGAEEPEMTRDIAPFLASGIRIHTGGSTDIYVDTGLSEKTIERTVGGLDFDLGRMLVNFQDIDFTLREVDWRGLVEQGDILKVVNASADEAGIYIIEDIESTFLRIKDLAPFKRLKPIQQHDNVTYDDAAFNTTSKVLSISADQTRFTTLDVGKFVYVLAVGDATYREIESVGGFTADGFAAEITLKDPFNELAAFPVTDLRVQVFDSEVIYSVGNNSPSYDNKIGQRSYGQISRVTQVPGTILLPNEPIYRVKEVVLIEPDDTDADPVLGGVPLTTRVNSAPQDTSPPDEFQVVAIRPMWAQSSQAGQLLRVGPVDPRNGSEGILTPLGGSDAQATFQVATAQFAAGDVGKYLLIKKSSEQINAGLFTIETYTDPQTIGVFKTGLTLLSEALVAESDLPWEMDGRFKWNGSLVRVTYDTLPGFSSISSFVEEDDERVTASSGLVRGFHPVYLEMTLNYELKSSAPGVVDAELAKRQLAAYINTFDSTDILNVSDIVTEFRRLYETIVGNVVQPTTINYELYAPSGKVVQFQTTDAVVLSATNAVDAVNQQLLSDALGHGVSDRTARYLTTPDLLTIVLV